VSCSVGLRHALCTCLSCCGHHHTTNIEGLLAVRLDMVKVLAVVTKIKASLSSVELCLDDNVVKAIQLEYLLRFNVSC
jgi:hypothetical protein